MIRREIEVTRKGLPRPIDVTYGTNLIPIEFVVTDFNIPEGSTAVAYNSGKSGEVNKQLCEIDGNIITFTPEAGFFEKGRNELQYRVVHDNRSLFSFMCRVNCEKSYSDDDAVEIESQPTLLEQVLTELGTIKENGGGGGATHEQIAQIEKNKQDISKISQQIDNQQNTIDDVSEMMAILGNPDGTETYEFKEITAQKNTGYYNAQGVLTSGQYHIVVDVTNGEQYKIKCNSGWDLRAYLLMNNDSVVYVYPREDNSIWHSDVLENQIIIEIPSNVNKLVVNSMDSAYLGVFKRYVKEDVLDGATENLQKIVDISSLFVDAYETQSITLSKGFMQVNGTLNSYDGCNYCEIDVLCGEKYKVTSMFGYNARQYVLLDSNSVVKAIYPSENSSTEKTETSTVEINVDGKLYVNDYSARAKVQKCVGYKFMDIYSNKLFGKKVLFFGDSITASSGSWADATTIMSNNDMTGNNYGVGGSTYVVRENADNSNCIYNRIKHVHSLGTQNDADYIILQGGVNDAFLDLPLGTMLSENDFTTELDTTTFSGAFEMAIRYVLKNWLGKKVGFIANAKIPRNTNLKNYIEMAKNICKKYSVPICDLWNESGICAGIQEVNEQYFGIDGESIGHGGTHPTVEGYKLYINDKVEAWMKSL